MPYHTTDDGCRLAYALSGPDAGAARSCCRTRSAPTAGCGTRQIDALARALPRAALRHARPRRVGRAGRRLLASIASAATSLVADGRTWASRGRDVCGVSIGGITALWLGVHAPDRVHRLVLANTAARIGSVAFWSERMRLVARRRARRRWPTSTMERWFTPAFRPAEPDTVARMRATLLRRAGGRLSRLLRGAARRRPAGRRGARARPRRWS